MRNLTITVTGTQQKKVYIRVLANDVPITRGKLTSRPGESEIKFRANTCAYHRRRISSVLLACAASVSSRVITRKLERKQKKKGFPLPLPRHSIFFCSGPGFLDEPREETLATQVTVLRDE